MQYIQGKDRERSMLFPQCLDQIVSADNDERFINLFAESIHIPDYKFVTN